MTATQIKHIFLLLQASLLLCGIALLLSTSKIAMAQPTNNLSGYTEGAQTDLGRAFIYHLHSRYDIVQDPEINHYIRNIGHKIVQHTDNSKRFRFYIINNPDINAFAGPDGVIGIHTGLIQSVSTEDELASVIAHEIAHVTQEHLYRRMVLQSESSLPQIASMIAAILIGMHDSNAGMAALMGSSAYQIEQQLKYSRLHEYEADHAGINFLNLSGYDPHAMPDFFEKLANSYQNYGSGAPEILRTHPLTENRLAKAQARAHSLKSDKKPTDNSTLRLIQLRLESVYEAEWVRSFGVTLDKETKCYQSALSEITIKNSNNIPPCLDEIIKSNNQQYLYHAIKLELLSKLPNTNPKASNIEPSFSYDLFPSNESMVVRYAAFLVRQEKREHAIEILNNHLSAERYKNEVYTMLSKLHEDEGNSAKSYYYLALANLDIGNIKRAAILTEKAKNNLTQSQDSLEQEIATLQEKLTKLLKNREDELGS